MNIPVTTWTTDDRCPACGTALTVTDDRTNSICQNCPACGWSVTWDGGADG